MVKEDVLALLDKYKDRTIEISLDNEGGMLYSGIDGHWLFTKENTLVEVKKNLNDGPHGYSVVNQGQSPFVITEVPYTDISHVRVPIKNDLDDIKYALDGLTPAGTSKSLDDITKEIESDTIRKAVSTRGYLNTENVAPGTPYGSFKGTAISTDIDGIPQYMKDSLLKKEETTEGSEG